MPKLFYVTGLGGSIKNGLGHYLVDNYQLDDYLELNKEFNALSYSDQNKVLVQKLNQFKGEDFRIIAVSLGAYLVLNEILKAEYASLKKVLLFSPVLGPVMVDGGGKIPPNYSNFKRLLRTTKSDVNIRIVYGTEDPICPAVNVNNFIKNIKNLDIQPLPNQDHTLSITDVQKAIEEFLS